MHEKDLADLQNYSATTTPETPGVDIVTTPPEEEKPFPYNDAEAFVRTYPDPGKLLAAIAVALDTPEEALAHKLAVAQLRTKIMDRSLFDRPIAEMSEVERGVYGECLQVMIKELQQPTPMPQTQPPFRPRTTEEEAGRVPLKR
jgi:hypothetical protein